MLFYLEKKKKCQQARRRLGGETVATGHRGVRTAGSHLPLAQRTNFQPKHRSSRRIWWYAGKQQRPMARHGQSEGPHRSILTALFSLLLSELPTG